MNNFPQDLIEKNKWICWREEERDGDKTKIPINPRTGKYASSTDDSTWTDYQTAKNAHKNTQIKTDGLGFVFSQDDLIVGIDLDKCRDPEDGRLDDWAMKIMEKLDSYTEVSPSGTGIHVIVKGALPGDKNRKDGVEIYETNRFFTMTGNRVPGTEKEVEVRVEELKEVYKEHLHKEKERNTETTTPQETDISQDEILEKAFNASNGDKFQALWRGNTSMYGGDHSRADQALCNLLSFWTGGDQAKIDQMFRQSGLCRDKWRNRQDYRQRTIKKAIQSCNEFYEPGKEIPDIEEILGSVKENKSLDWKQLQSIIDDKEFDSGKARQRIGQAINQLYNFVTLKDTEDIWVFKNPVYACEGSNVIEEELAENLDGLTTHDRNEILNHVRIKTRRERPREAPHKNIIPVKNGHYNLETGELEEPDPERFIVNEIPVEYDADADCPQIKEFLKEVVEEENVKVLQEMFGYCLYRDYPFRKAFMMLGEGQNGKSQVLKLLNKLLGEDNIATPSLHQLSETRFAQAQLYGKLANINGDIDGGVLQRTGFMKMLTGGDLINGEKKGVQNPLKFYNYAKLIYAANQLPHPQNDQTDAFFSRWILIEFPHKFTDEDDEHKDAIKNIAGKLTTEEEMQGLLNWAVEGLERILDQGQFTETKRMQEVKLRWLMETDPIQVFAEHMLERDDGNFITKDDMYEFYGDFCDYHGAFVEEKNVFGRKLNKALTFVRPARPQINGRRENCWKNVRFKNGMDSLFKDGDDYVRDTMDKSKTSRVRARGVNENIGNNPDIPDADVISKRLLNLLRESTEPVDEVEIQEQLDIAYDDLEPVLDRLSKHGDIFEPKSGFWQVL